MSYRWWISIAIFLFGAGFILGLGTPESMAEFAAEDIAALEELARFLASLPLPVTALFIFLKNASVVIMGFIFSPVLCLLPVLTLFFNGWFLAFVALTVVQEESLGFVLAGLLPHGIIELPALILGQAAALSFGTTVILTVFRRKRKDELLPHAKKDLRYILISLALLLPAAIIETYVTPLLIS